MDLKAALTKFSADADALAEVSTEPKDTPDSLDNLLVEVYAHNCTFTGTLTPNGKKAILDALGRSPRD